MSKSSGRQLRILMVLENCAYPQDVRVRHEAETLAAASYTVTVLAPHESRQAWHEVIHGVRVHRFPGFSASHGVLGYLAEFGFATIILTVMALWRWLRDGVDVVHLHNPPDTLFVAALLPKLAGKRVVFDHHDLAAELYAAKVQAPNPRLLRLLTRLEHYTCRLADVIIASNHSYRQHDIDQHGVRADRVCIVRNGPDLRESAAPSFQPKAAGSPVIIGYIGHIAAQDGFDQLLYALHHLKFDLGQHAWSCLVIGPAEDLDALRALAAELDVADRVTFTGGKPHHEALELLATVDIGVAPEPYNAFNDHSTMIKVLEYMALGKPVVAYDLTEHRITAGDAALYAANEGPRELARQIAILLEDPAERLRLGKIGRQRIEEQLSWEHSARSLLACYQAIAADRPLPAAG